MGTPSTSNTSKLTSFLGNGSFGFVFKVENSDNTFSAVKIIYRNNPEDEKQLKRECIIVKGNEHKNIVQLQNAFEIRLNNKDIDQLLKIMGDDVSNDASERIYFIQNRIRRLVSF